MSAQSGLYPGLGAQMYAANATNPREPTWLAPRTPQPTIQDGRSSLGFAVNGGVTTSLNVLFAAAPAGTAFNVMYDIDPEFGNEYVLQAVTAVALQTLYTWSTNGLILLTGFIRITNAGGTVINEAYIQQQASLG